MSGETASAVIIGGGVIGVAIACELAEVGVTDVVLLDKGPLGGGSTSKAAGGVRAQFSDRVNIELAARSLETFAGFKERFGQDIDLHTPGYLFLLDAAADVADFEASVRLQNSLGVPSRIITAREAQAMCPLASMDGVLAAAYSPTDGHCSPESVVLGYASAARRGGARLYPGRAAVGIDLDGTRITGVRTAGDGRIATGTVICAAGAWSREVGQWAGVDLPVAPLRRQILVSEPLAGICRRLVQGSRPVGGRRPARGPAAPADPGFRAASRDTGRDAVHHRLRLDLLLPPGRPRHLARHVGP
jgi:sarcosine oxidase subunit beta